MALDATGACHPLPDSQDSNLSLAIPSTDELEVNSRLTFIEWGDALTLPEYLEESKILTKVPLAENYGMVSWILTDKDKPLNQRPILASCETFRKRAFVTNQNGQVSESIIYGIASVFVNSSHRYMGYGTRLMHELGSVLSEWHMGPLRSVGSILYSDIGKDYYTKRGWSASPVNNHVELDPISCNVPPHVHLLAKEDVSQLCKDDEAIARKSLVNSSSRKTRMMIVPDADHMQWHISKEEFACQKLFGKVPRAKGALAGDYKHSSRIWAVWVHRYYGHPSSCPENNTLYILRFVIENQDPSQSQIKMQAECVREVLQTAQAEAAEWGLQSVKLWNPTALALDLLERSGLEYRQVEREDDSIASLKWFENDSSADAELEWVACEKYAWV